MQHFCEISSFFKGGYIFLGFFFVFQSGAAFPAICCSLELKSVFCMHFGARISHLRAHLAFGFKCPLGFLAFGFWLCSGFLLAFSFWLHFGSWLLVIGFWLLAFGFLAFSFFGPWLLALASLWLLALGFGFTWLLAFGFLWPLISSISQEKT